MLYKINVWHDWNEEKNDLLFCSDGDWWKAKHLTTHDVGYVPNNYVALEESLESYE